MSADLPKRADVVIAGGGIMGISLARELARRGAGRVLLLERNVIGAGASGRTGALLRQHYTNVPEATLAARSLTVFRNWSDFVGGDCGFDETGLIVTIPTLGDFEDNVPRLQAVVAQLRSIGTKIDLVTADELKQIDPAGDFGDIGLATFEPESGTVDAVATTSSVAKAALETGVTIVEGVDVRSIETAGSRVTGVKTSAGAIEADCVVLALGPWTPAVTRGLGLELPIDALRVQIAVFQTPSSLPSPRWSYVDNVAGIFCRPWGTGRTMVGLGGGEQHDPVDPDHFERRNDTGYPDIARAAVARRFPSFGRAVYLDGRACLYDMTPDGHPIIGPAGPDGLYVAAGFCGAGFKKGPAVGEALAASIVGEPVDWVDLHPFRLDRFTGEQWRKPWSPHEYRLASDFGHGF